MNGESMTELILVNELDQQIGTADRSRCHSGKGILHRAFTIFVFNQDGQVLIQKRSNGKTLWPCTWETSCSGHPVVGEDLVAAAQKRLQEELGIRTELETHGKFQYQASYEDEGSENEICFVLSGKYDGVIRPDPQEVSEYRWVDADELKGEIADSRDEHAPWLITGLEMVSSQGGTDG